MDLNSIPLPDKLRILTVVYALKMFFFNTVGCIFWTIRQISVYVRHTNVKPRQHKNSIWKCHLCHLGITSCHSLYSKSADLPSWPLNALSVQISSLTLWLAELLSCTWVPSTPLILYSAALPLHPPSLSSALNSSHVALKQNRPVHLIMIMIKCTDEANTCLRKEKKINADHQIMMNNFTATSSCGGRRALW